MMNKKFIFIILFGMSASLAAQPIQYFMQRSSINVSSMSDAKRFQMFLSGSQSLVGFEKAPKSVLLNAITPIRTPGTTVYETDETRHFTGGTIHTETYGVHTKIQAMLGYNYRLFVSEKTHLTFGLGAGAKQSNSNYKKLDLTQDFQNKEEALFITQFGARFDAVRWTASIFKDVNDWYAEFTWGRLQKAETYDLYDVDKKIWRAQAALLLRYNQELQTQTLRISANALYLDKFGLGISYQTMKDCSLNAMMQVTSYLRIGYAYQLLNFSKIAQKHEIAVHYTTFQK